MKKDIAIDRSAQLAGQLRATLGKLRRRLRQAVGPGELNWSQVAVLGHLEREGPLTGSALARLEGMRSQSMGAAVATLQAEGLVDTSPDPNDRRQMLIALTPRAREWVMRSRSAREDWLANVIQAQFTTEEQQILAEAVQLLARLANA